MAGGIAVVLVLFVAGMAFPGADLRAAPQIEISFETDSAASQKLVHARAEFPAGQETVYAIFNGVTAYPLLHDWIQETTRVGTGRNSQEYLVKFMFPWPAGSQWSRVEVQHKGNAIYWNQLEGSLRANDGYISIEAAEDGVRIDYRAAIDIGLPELWTQSYKKKFVSEFLSAVCKRAEAASATKNLLLTSVVEP
jgi:uncharacterized membrane protein